MYAPLRTLHLSLFAANQSLNFGAFENFSTNLELDMLGTGNTGLAQQSGLLAWRQLCHEALGSPIAIVFSL